MTKWYQGSTPAQSDNSQAETHVTPTDIIEGQRRAQVIAAVPDPIYILEGGNQFNICLKILIDILVYVLKFPRR
jgi:hypothetical protein